MVICLSSITVCVPIADRCYDFSVCAHIAGIFYDYMICVPKRSASISECGRSFFVEDVVSGNTLDRINIHLLY
jgi:hypothetical protein